jgi:hypothetical protein
MSINDDSGGRLENGKGCSKWEGKGCTQFEQACSVPETVPSLASTPIPHPYPWCSCLIVSAPNFVTPSHPPYPYTKRSSHSPLPSPCSRVIQLDRGHCLQESPPSMTRSTHCSASSLAPPPLIVRQGSWQRYAPGPSSGHLSILCSETQVCGCVM